jgi:hypothetical protein
MPSIVSQTGPTDEGELLWCVKYESSYYDSDPRGSSTVPVNVRAYVLAKNREEAIEKAGPEIARARKQADKGAKEQILAAVATLEELMAARDSSNDGRLGWTSTTPLVRVQLSHPDDAKRYRLAVCLVPVE